MPPHHFKFQIKKNKIKYDTFFIIIIPPSPLISLPTFILFDFIIIVYFISSYFPPFWFLATTNLRFQMGWSKNSSIGCFSGRKPVKCGCDKFMRTWVSSSNIDESPKRKFCRCWNYFVVSEFGFFLFSFH